MTLRDRIRKEYKQEVVSGSGMISVMNDQNIIIFGGTIRIEATRTLRRMTGMRASVDIEQRHKAVGMQTHI